VARVRGQKEWGTRVFFVFVLAFGILANLGCVLSSGITFGPKWPLDLGEHEAD
jgi:hypothetical protein